MVVGETWNVGRLLSQVTFKLPRWQLPLRQLLRTGSKTVLMKKRKRSTKKVWITCGKPSLNMTICDFFDYGQQHMCPQLSPMWKRIVSLIWFGNDRTKMVVGRSWTFTRLRIGPKEACLGRFLRMLTSWMLRAMVI